MERNPHAFESMLTGMPSRQHPRENHFVIDRISGVIAPKQVDYEMVLRLCLEPQFGIRTYETVAEVIESALRRNIEKAQGLIKKLKWAYPMMRPSNFRIGQMLGGIETHFEQAALLEHGAILGMVRAYYHIKRDTVGRDTHFVKHFGSNLGDLIKNTASYAVLQHFPISFRQSVRDLSQTKHVRMCSHALEHLLNITLEPYHDCEHGEKHHLQHFLAEELMAAILPIEQRARLIFDFLRMFDSLQSKQIPRDRSYAAD